MAKKKQSAIAWNRVRKVDTDENGVAYFKGSFSKLRQAILNGSKIDGVALRSGEVGFLLSDVSEVDLEAILAPTKTARDFTEEPGIRFDTSDVKPSRDGEIIKGNPEEEGDDSVIKEVKMLHSALKVMNKIARDNGETQEDVLTACLHRGIENMVMEILEKENPELKKRLVIESVNESGGLKEAGIESMQVSPETREYVKRVYAESGGKKPESAKSIMQKFQKENPRVLASLDDAENEQKTLEKVSEFEKETGVEIEVLDDESTMPIEVQETLRKMRAEGHDVKVQGFKPKDGDRSVLEQLKKKLGL